MAEETPADRLWLQHPVDAKRDHIRGDPAAPGAVTVVLYGDYLCPYCRRLRPIMVRLRQALGQNMAFVFRHFFNESNHPGATFMARAAEAAGKQADANEYYAMLVKTCEGGNSTRPELAHARELVAKR